VYPSRRVDAPLHAVSLLLKSKISAVSQGEARINTQRRIFIL
jgi:hypothetical protein